MAKNIKSLDGIPITMSEYYYGTSYTDWENLPYFEAIKKRRDLAKELYKRLSFHFKDQKMDYSDQVRLQDVYKAWHDNERLLDEKDMII